MAGRPWHWAREMWLDYCVRRGDRTAAEIGALFGYSKAAVVLKAHRMGLRLPAVGGAPKGNSNGAATQYRTGHYPGRWRKR